MEFFRKTPANASEPNRMGPKKKGGLSADAQKIGFYSVVSAVMVILIMLFVNLTFAKLPSKYTEIDISRTGLYSLSEQTVETVARVDRETEIYWIVQNGNENEEIRLLLDRYKDLSDRIHVTRVDPVVNPGFATQYTKDNVEDNSLIVVNDLRSRVIMYGAIFTQTYDYSSSQGGMSNNFNGEKEITSAIDYVSDGHIPTVYRVTGHDEKILTVALENQITAENYIVKTLKLLAEGSVPSDADCLLINGPTVDYTADEARWIREYLDRGGRLMLLTDAQHTELPNLMSVVADYGIEVDDGLVLEGNANMCYGSYPMQLIPMIAYHPITEPVIKGSCSLLMPMAHGLKLPEATPEGVSIVSLLNTSGQAFSKKGKITSLLQEKEDAVGPFTLAAAIEERLASGNTRIVWYSTSFFMENEYNEISNGANGDLAINTLAWLCGRDSNITLHSKKLSEERLTMPSGATTRTGILLIGVIPVIYLLIGIVVTLMRRKK